MPHTRNVYPTEDLFINNAYNFKFKCTISFGGQDENRQWIFVSVFFCKSQSIYIPQRHAAKQLQM